MSYKLYTDGAFQEHQNPNVYGWGYVLFDENDNLVHQDKGYSGEFLESRQIGGECMAVIEGLNLCFSKGITDVEVCYDYSGVEKWAVGGWKTNKPVSKKYVSDFISIKSKLSNLAEESAQPFNLSFNKIEGHSGDKGNDIADNLANLGILESKKAD